MLSNVPSSSHLFFCCKFSHGQKLHPSEKRRWSSKTYYLPFTNSLVQPLPSIRCHPLARSASHDCPNFEINGLFSPWSPSFMYASVHSAKCFLSLDFILCSNPWLPGVLEGRATCFPLLHRCFSGTSALRLELPFPCSDGDCLLNLHS